MLSTKVAILLICCVVAPILATTHSDVDDDAVLFNQQAARPGQFPFIVSIRWTTPSTFRGSGVILSNNWVLTAASALPVHPLRQMALYVGSHTERDGRRVSVIAFARHPQYNSRTRNNDIAMVRTDIQFNERVRPINLPTANVEGSKATLTIIGWGGARNPLGVRVGDRMFSTLQTRSVRTMPHGQCRTRMGNMVRLLHPTSLCTMDVRQGRLCVADTGGPVFNAQMQVVGLHSWQLSCINNFPTVFVNVYRHLNFIRQHMRT